MLEQRLKSLDTLMAEHRGIEQMLSILAAVAWRLDHGGDVPDVMLDGMLAFLQNFADGCHHAKEEDTLFPALAKHGLTADMSAVNALLTQHDTGRAYVREMRAAAERLRAGDRQAAAELASTARAYVELLREHIRIEDEYLYPMAADTLSAAEDATLCEAFEQVERARTGPGEHERYHRMIDEYRKVVAGW